MFLYINAEGETPAQTTEVKCESVKPKEAKDCKTATDVKKDQECQFVAASGETAASCKLVTKATSSSKILNIFKITFALLIIFTIL
jgi:hypothetical protein